MSSNNNNNEKNYSNYDERADFIKNETLDRVYNIYQNIMIILNLLTDTVFSIESIKNPSYEELIYVNNNNNNNNIINNNNYNNNDNNNDSNNTTNNDDDNNKL